MRLPESGLMVQGSLMIQTKEQPNQATRINLITLLGHQFTQGISLKFKMILMSQPENGLMVQDSQMIQIRELLRQATRINLITMQDHLFILDTLHKLNQESQYVHGLMVLDSQTIQINKLLRQGIKTNSKDFLSHRLLHRNKDKNIHQDSLNLIQTLQQEHMLMALFIQRILILRPLNNFITINLIDLLFHLLQLKN